jgi:hypothetical protein
MSVALPIAALGLSTLTVVPAFAAAPIPQNAESHPVCTTICFGQVSTQGPGGAQDEFIELENIGPSPVDISGYTVSACPVAGPPELLAAIPSGTSVQGTIIDPNAVTGRFYLLANLQGSTRSTPPDQLYSRDVQRLGGLQLRSAPTPSNPRGTIVDSIGFTVGNQCTETMPAPSQSPAFVDQSVLRVAGDTNVNAFDFVLISPSMPRNSSF